MATDQITVHLGTAVRLVGVNRFYARRVLQRCERGEISLEEAAELLIAAARADGATIEATTVRRFMPDALV